MTDTALTALLTERIEKRVRYALASAMAGEVVKRRYRLQFEESKHPRADDGKFSEGAGGGRIGIVKGSKGIPRAEMPQIRSALVPDFLAQLKSRGVGSKQVSIPVAKLKATQREINLDKVETMRAKLRNPDPAEVAPTEKPVLASRDGYILDGHHRWAALTAESPQSPMELIQVDADIDTLLSLARNFNQVEFKGVDQNAAGYKDQYPWKMPKPKKRKSPAYSFEPKKPKPFKFDWSIKPPKPKPQTAADVGANLASAGEVETPRTIPSLPGQKSLFARMRVAVERYRQNKPAPGQKSLQFREDQHPREDDGKFAEKGSGGGEKNKNIPTSQDKTADLAADAIKAYKEQGTKSRYFKNWFGDWEKDPANASKVVDKKTGEPKETYEVKKVFHGTEEKFESFDSKKQAAHGTVAGRGFYFAEDWRVANHWNKSRETLIEAFLSIKNPFDFDKEYDEQTIDKILQSAANITRVEIDTLREDWKRYLLSPDAFRRDVKKNHGDWLWDFLSYRATNRHTANEVLARVGFDGLTHISNDDMGGVAHSLRDRSQDDKLYGRVWVAFAPTQIKTTNNRGTFDPQDDRMAYARQFRESVERYRFEESKHPRDDGGKFSESSGSKAKDPQPEPTEKDFFPEKPTKKEKVKVFDMFGEGAVHIGMVRAANLKSAFEAAFRNPAIKKLPRVGLRRQGTEGPIPVQSSPQEESRQRSKEKRESRKQKIEEWSQKNLELAGEANAIRLESTDPDAHYYFLIGKSPASTEGGLWRLWTVMKSLRHRVHGEQKDVPWSHVNYKSREKAIRAASGDAPDNEIPVVSAGEYKVVETRYHRSGMKDRYSRILEGEVMETAQITARMNQAIREKYAKPVFNPSTGQWEESKHPRDQGGQFTSKGGGYSGKKQQTDIGEDAHKTISSQISSAATRRDWKNMPEDFKKEAIENLKQSLLGYFSGKSGNEISALNSLKKARDFPEIQEAANRLRGQAAAPAHAPVNVDPRELQAADDAIARIGTPTPETVKSYVEAVMQHPYYKAAESRMNAAANETKSGDARMWSKEKHSGPDGQYTPERKALHDKIVNSMLNPNATQKRSASGKPVAVFLMGPPGAGKTTAGQPAVAALGFDPKTDFTVINADDVKAALPEYQGWNAGLVHEESSDVAEGALTAAAIQQKHNTIFDLTGANSEKMAASATELQKNGYEVHMIQVSLPSHKVAQRVWDRFRGNAFGSKDKNAEPGRFVPPDYAYLGVDSKPDKTYAALKSHPAVQSWTQLSTDVTYGKPPIVLDQGKRPEPTLRKFSPKMMRMLSGSA